MADIELIRILGTLNKLKDIPDITNRFLLYELLLRRYDSLRKDQNGNTPQNIDSMSVGLEAEPIESCGALDVELFLQSGLVTLLGDCENRTRNSPLLCLSVCLKLDQITGRIELSASTHLVASIINIIRDAVEANDRPICQAAILCFSNQTLKKDSVVEQLDTLLEVLISAKKKFNDRSVMFDFLQAIKRLMEQIPIKMVSCSTVWFRHVYPLVTHNNVTIRETASAFLHLLIPDLMSHEQEFPRGLGKIISEDIIKSSKPGSDAPNIAGDLERMVGSQEQALHAISACSILITMLGKEYHNSNICLKFLTVIEAGFKNSSLEVRLEAFRTWRTVINNFSLDIDTLTKVSRVNLIMQVFRRGMVSRCCEMTDSAMLTTWWLFLTKLGDKLPSLYDEVIAPYLKLLVEGLSDTEASDPSKHHSNFTKLRSPLGSDPSYASPALRLTPLTPNPFSTDGNTLRKSMSAGNIRSPSTPSSSATNLNNGSVIRSPGSTLGFLSGRMGSGGKSSRMDDNSAGILNATGTGEVTDGDGIQGRRLRTAVLVMLRLLTPGVKLNTQQQEALEQKPNDPHLDSLGVNVYERTSILLKHSVTLIRMIRMIFSVASSLSEHTTSESERRLKVLWSLLVTRLSTVLVECSKNEKQEEENIVSALLDCLQDVTEKWEQNKQFCHELVRTVVDVVPKQILSSVSPYQAQLLQARVIMDDVPVPVKPSFTTSFAADPSIKTFLQLQSPPPGESVIQSPSRIQHTDSIGIPKQVIGALSPSKQQQQVGGFLNRPPPPPEIKKSPLKVSAKGQEPKRRSVRRQLTVNDMRDDEFVSIVPAVPKSCRRILTDHQKEVMKEKRVLPVMYNNLDNSTQDFSQHFNSSNDTQSQFLDMSQMAPPGDNMTTNDLTASTTDKSHNQSSALRTDVARCSVIKDPPQASVNSSTTVTAFIDEEAAVSKTFEELREERLITEIDKTKLREVTVNLCRVEEGQLPCVTPTKNVTPRKGRDLGMDNGNLGDTGLDKNSSTAGLTFSGRVTPLRRASQSTDLKASDQEPDVSNQLTSTLRISPRKMSPSVKKEKEKGRSDLVDNIVAKNIENAESSREKSKGLNNKKEVQKCCVCLKQLSAQFISSLTSPSGRKRVARTAEEDAALQNEFLLFIRSIPTDNCQSCSCCREEERQEVLDTERVYEEIRHLIAVESQIARNNAELLSNDVNGTPQILNARMERRDSSEKENNSEETTENSVDIRSESKIDIVEVNGDESNTSPRKRATRLQEQSGNIFSLITDDNFDASGNAVSVESRHKSQILTQQSMTEPSRKLEARSSANDSKQGDESQEVRRRSSARRNLYGREEESKIEGVTSDVLPLSSPQTKGNKKQNAASQAEIRKPKQMEELFPDKTVEDKSSKTAVVADAVDKMNQEKPAKGNRGRKARKSLEAGQMEANQRIENYFGLSLRSSMKESQSSDNMQKNVKSLRTEDLKNGTESNVAMTKPEKVNKLLNTKKKSSRSSSDSLNSSLVLVEDSQMAMLEFPNENVFLAETQPCEDMESGMIEESQLMGIRDVPDSQEDENPQKSSPVMTDKTSEDREKPKMKDDSKSKTNRECNKESTTAVNFVAVSTMHASTSSVDDSVDHAATVFLDHARSVLSPTKVQEVPSSVEVPEVEKERFKTKEKKKSKKNTEGSKVSPTAVNSVEISAMETSTVSPVDHAATVFFDQARSVLSHSKSQPASISAQVKQVKAAKNSVKSLSSKLSNKKKNQSSVAADDDDDDDDVPLTALVQNLKSGRRKSSPFTLKKTSPLRRKVMGGLLSPQTRGKRARPASFDSKSSDEDDLPLFSLKRRRLTRASKGEASADKKEVVANVMEEAVDKDKVEAADGTGKKVAEDAVDVDKSSKCLENSVQSKIDTASSVIVNQAGSVIVEKSSETKVDQSNRMDTNKLIMEIEQMDSLEMDQPNTTMDRLHMMNAEQSNSVKVKPTSTVKEKADLVDSNQAITLKTGLTNTPLAVQIESTPVSTPVNITPKCSPLFGTRNASERGIPETPTSAKRQTINRFHQPRPELMTRSQFMLHVATKTASPNQLTGGGVMMAPPSPMITSRAESVIKIPASPRTAVRPESVIKSSSKDEAESISLSSLSNSAGVDALIHTGLNQNANNGEAACNHVSESADSAKQTRPEPVFFTQHGSETSTPSANQLSNIESGLAEENSVLKSSAQSDQEVPKSVSMDTVGSEMGTPGLETPLLRKGRAVLRVFSPQSSPSAGILRKRRVIAAGEEEPSPARKQRRVCFSDNVETLVIPNRHEVKQMSRSRRLVNSTTLSLDLESHEEAIMNSTEPSATSKISEKNLESEGKNENMNDKVSENDSNISSALDGDSAAIVTDKSTAENSGNESVVLDSTKSSTITAAAVNEPITGDEAMDTDNCETDDTDQQSSDITTRLDSHDGTADVSVINNESSDHNVSYAEECEIFLQERNLVSAGSAEKSVEKVRNVEMETETNESSVEVVTEDVSSGYGGVGSSDGVGSSGGVTVCNGDVPVCSGGVVEKKRYINAQLINCTDSIDVMAWDRGVRTVLRSKKIYTLGDLASLSADRPPSLPLSLPIIISALEAYAVRKYGKAVTSATSDTAASRGLACSATSKINNTCDAALSSLSNNEADKLSGSSALGQDVTHTATVENTIKTNSDIATSKDNDKTDNQNEAEMAEASWEDAFNRNGEGSRENTESPKKEFRNIGSGTETVDDGIMVNVTEREGGRGQVDLVSRMREMSERLETENLSAEDLAQVKLIVMEMAGKVFRK